MGTTILYSDNIVKKYNDSEEVSLGHIESISASVKADFSKAQTVKYFKAGDAVLFKTTTFHRGTENLSNKDRVFIYMHFTRGALVPRLRIKASETKPKRIEL
jgi:ectoine hydroxylase-related dioxygenase (phytanoyl-CoA dioxygenase family)